MHATKQGVRDLNGPRMNGTGYNGAKSATCPHYRAPDTVATYTVEKLVPGEHEQPTTVRVVCCANCDLELYLADD